MPLSSVVVHSNIDYIHVLPNEWITKMNESSPYWETILFVFACWADFKFAALGRLQITFHFF